MQTDAVLSTNDQSDMGFDNNSSLPALKVDSINLPELARQNLRTSRSRPMPIQSKMVHEAAELDE